MAKKTEDKEIYRMQTFVTGEQSLQIKDRLKEIGLTTNAAYLRLLIMKDLSNNS